MKKTFRIPPHIASELLGAGFLPFELPHWPLIQAESSTEATMLLNQNMNILIRIYHNKIKDAFKELEATDKKNLKYVMSYIIQYRVFIIKLELLLINFDGLEYLELTDN